MTAQGVFPKIDGDVLYSSETNLFRRSGRIFAAGSTPAILSGTDFQTCGSFLIGAGSLSGNPVQINMVLSTIKHAGDTIQIRVSGLAGNFSLQCGSDADSQGTNLVGVGNFFLGTPMPCMGAINFFQNGGTKKVGVGGQDAMFWANTTTSNIDPSQNLVFFLDLRTQLATTGKYNVYSIYSSVEVF